MSQTIHKGWIDEATEAFRGGGKLLADHHWSIANITKDEGGASSYGRGELPLVERVLGEDMPPSARGQK